MSERKRRCEGCGVVLPRWYTDVWCAATCLPQLYQKLAHLLERGNHGLFGGSLTLTALFRGRRR